MKRVHPSEMYTQSPLSNITQSTIPESTIQSTETETFPTTAILPITAVSSLTATAEFPTTLQSLLTNQSTIQANMDIQLPKTLPNNSDFSLQIASNAFSTKSSSLPTGADEMNCVPIKNISIQELLATAKSDNSKSANEIVETVSFHPKETSSENDLTELDDVEQTGVKPDNVEQTGIKTDNVEQTGIKTEDVEQTGVKNDDVEQTRVKNDDVDDASSPTQPKFKINSDIFHAPKSPTVVLEDGAESFT